MVDIFDEVDEELRAERAQQLLKRYGGLIVAAAVLIVGAAAGWQGWRWYEARRDQAAAAQYLHAMNLAAAPGAGGSDASRTAAIDAFARLAATLPEGYLKIPAVIVRMLFPMAALVSLFFLLRGHNASGGGFVGGLVTATAVIAQPAKEGKGSSASKSSNTTKTKS